ncbi:predicted protein [Nematostella vectensis]|uniref:Ras-related protein Rab-43 n=1 Tax=Nematostella vectensis TaxID=45351 RepID=A7SMW9_NEMVE|nr:predicted protein [Nematostella vectensis]|eukprot:XP_001627045.1 predicted protein [Nematostella vectensis]
MREPSTEEFFDYLFKIVLIGDPGVGKTCIVQRFRSGTFVERNGSTIGVDFTMRSVQVDNKKIKLQIWDTAGQERFRTITQSYYRSCNGVIIAYDITKCDTFKNVIRWGEDVQKYAPENAIKLLVGNKKDLEREREVSLEDAVNCASHYGMLDVLETSAKDATNIEAAFYRLARELKNRCEEGSGLENIDDGGITLDSRQVHRKWSCCS